jgi:triosephosphate isomerase
LLRTPLIAANWKMHNTVGEAMAFSDRFLPLVKDLTGVEMVICPAFTVLSSLGRVLLPSQVKMGAQDVFWEEKGAFTGEVSPAMLTDVGCSYAIIGHSERRQLLGETDVTVNRKVNAALVSGLKPILCVGETLQERKTNRAREVVKGQLEGALKDIAINPGELVIAYEPVWAIGTGVNASTDDAQEMIGFIRDYVRKLYNGQSQSVRILYGGSVKPDNIEGFMAREDIDGALVGGASLDAVSLAEIVRLCRK